MGLDQYATTRALEEGDERQTDLESGRMFYSWRKHPNLQGWMERLYRQKGGQGSEKGSFNCVTVRLELADIDRLETDVLADRLPQTEGFFFGKSEPEMKKGDLLFIKLARALLAEGQVVLYDSWW